jgi:hypothetical protein
MEPGHPDARSGAKPPSAASRALDGADNLVAGNHRNLTGRELALDDMQVGATYAAGVHPYQGFVFFGREDGNLSECQRVVLDRRGRPQQAGVHFLFLPPS